MKGQAMTRHLRYAVLALLLCVVAQAMAQEQPSLVGLDNGSFRRGAGLVVFADDGRMSIYVGAECLVQNATIACGLNGYTTADKFTGATVKRSAGRFSYEGNLPGHNVKFTLQAAADGDAVGVAMTRSGTWPPSAAWCSFQFYVPVSRYGGKIALADGRQVVLPNEAPKSNNLVSGAKRLILADADPALRLELSSEQGVTVVDGRQWGSTAYQISVGLGSQSAFVLSFPAGSGEQVKPRLCVSPLGYSSTGLREVTMEWPKGMPRPADGVRIMDAAGNVAAQGRFGATARFDYMQNEFAAFGFPQVKTPGRYVVQWDAGTERAIEIKPTIFTDAVWAPTLDTFIPWQMCHARVSFADGKLPELPPCHMDDGQRVPANLGAVVDGYYSYECDRTTFKAGDMIDCAIGGWHDAGDYDLNVHAQGHTLWKLALAYEEFGVDHDNTTFDIANQRVVAGKGDGIPDILQQVQWGVVWMLKMQQADGLVYPGVCCRPGGQYTASVLPEKLSDGKPGTKDERYVYVDYQADSQLAQVISLAAASRVLAKVDADLSRRCLAAAEQAYAYFGKAPATARPNVYFSKKNEDGRDGAIAAALAELYLTTHKQAYLDELAGMADRIAQGKVTWPAAYATGTGGWWYAPTVLARLVPQLPDGAGAGVGAGAGRGAGAAALKAAIITLCQRAQQEQASQSAPRPWPFMWWHQLDWGNSGHALNRIFDAYYLEKVAPGAFNLAATQREMLWMLGYHPLNDTVFVCDIAQVTPRFLYNGRLHGRYGDKPASVPGAVVPGMGGIKGAGMLVYNDAHGNYYHNEACIYTAADYLFAVHALKKAGY
jgi:hypothetical protein